MLLAPFRDMEHSEVRMSGENRLHVLAFDHHYELFELVGTERSLVQAAKRLIFDGLLLALDSGVQPAGAGILVDEEYGGDIAREAASRGFSVAMPVERFGPGEFEFRFEDFAAHLQEFAPTYAKALVRHNPRDDGSRNRRQAGRVLVLDQWCKRNGQKYMLEYLVEPLSDQLAACGGDRRRFQREIRPALMLEALQELRAAGLEPDVWKVEGMDSPQDCERLGRVATAEGRDHACCVMLGQGADMATVLRWLEAASGAPGYAGFAVGRTAWADAVRRWAAGEDRREDAVRTVAERYRSMVETFTQGRLGYFPRET